MSFYVNSFNMNGKSFTFSGAPSKISIKNESQLAMEIFDFFAICKTAGSRNWLFPAGNTPTPLTVTFDNLITLSFKKNNGDGTYSPWGKIFCPMIYQRSSGNGFTSLDLPYESTGSKSPYTFLMPETSLIHGNSTDSLSIRIEAIDNTTKTQSVSYMNDIMFVLRISQYSIDTVPYQYLISDSDINIPSSVNTNISF